MKRFIGVAVLLCIYKGVAAGPLLNEVSFSYGYWKMLEPIMSVSTDTSLRLNEVYQSYHFALTTKEYKNLSVSLSLPYTQLNLTSQLTVDSSNYVFDSVAINWYREPVFDTIKETRAGFTDMSVQAQYRNKFFSVQTGLHIPLNYNIFDKGVQLAWLGSGSKVFALNLSSGYYSKKITTSVGMEYNYKTYLENSLVKKDSWSGTLKGYVVYVHTMVNAGLIFEHSIKNFNYAQKVPVIRNEQPAPKQFYDEESNFIFNVYEYSDGELVNSDFEKIERIMPDPINRALDQYNLLLVKGYGRLLQSKDFSMGLFLSKQVFKSYELAGGFNTSLVQKDSPKGLSFWVQLKYRL